MVDHSGDEMMRAEKVRHLFVIEPETALGLKGGEGWEAECSGRGSAGRSPELRTGAGCAWMGSGVRTCQEKRKMGDSVAGIIGKALPDYAVKETGPRTALSLFSKYSCPLDNTGV